MVIMKLTGVSMNSIGSAFLVVLWIAGVVVAKGFWSTLFSIFVFPWGWYLAVEHFMALAGWL
jgi:hypothetical protein